MIRGTTPTHIFTTGVDLSTVSVLWLTYKQGTKVLTKSLEDITIDSEDTTRFSVTLSQSDTLRFDAGAYVGIQLRVLLADGTALASDIITLGAGEILKDGVIE